MHDDETDGGSSALCDDSLDVTQDNRWAGLFGDFSVLGASVQIVLEGRTVTSGPT